jgi:purine-nucleoside phosphorylase
MLDKIKHTTDFLLSKMKEPPQVGMITGTGLGLLTDRISEEFRIPYEEIPNFSQSTIEGHDGLLISGKLGGKTVVALKGRFHLYEGYTQQEATFPVRVIAMLGAKYLFISSAAGGLNPMFETGDLMVVTDHINLTGSNPLAGPNLDKFGPRFCDMSRVYSPDLIALARKKAIESGILIRQGVYAGVMGPSLETPAETRFLRMIGADAVGMSTVSEAIVGSHSGLEITAIVVITNVNLPDCMQMTSLEEIIATARRAGASLSELWKKIVLSLPEHEAIP